MGEKVKDSSRWPPGLIPFQAPDIVLCIIILFMNRIIKDELAGIPSPTIEAILGRKTKITLVGEGVSYPQNREFGGKKFSGLAYQYEISGLPKYGDKGGTWDTQLTVWVPAITSLPDYSPKPPHMKIFINTTNGEVVLTEDKNTMMKVYEEISRQLEEA